MKNYNLKIAIMEEGNFYNSLIETYIISFCNKGKCPKLKWVIKSYTDIDVFRKSTKNTQMVVFDNYFKRCNRNSAYNVCEVTEEIKLKNKNCLFVSITGYHDMLITAELFKEGELQFYFSKQINVLSQRIEEHCSIPALYKIIDKLLSGFAQKSDSHSHQSENTGKLRISA